MNKALSEPKLERSIIGSLLGTAIGDAIGLPTEGLSKRRLARLYPNLDGHRLVLRKGMCSDDTEHTCMVSRALIESQGDVSIFTKSMSAQLRLWIVCLPAGAGLATLRACVKLLALVSERKSGVFSAGNGPAMRSAIIGVRYGHDLHKMRELVSASTKITHTDPKAEFGTVAVALAAYIASTGECVSSEYQEKLQGMLGQDADEFLQLVDSAVKSAAKDEKTEIFAEKLGLGNGVTGYVYHTVPIVLHVWFRHSNDYQQAMLSIIRCGGDTDTTAAILGGIIGAHVGEEGIPATWREDLVEWPRSVGWMRRLGSALAASPGSNVIKVPGVPILAVLIRNVLFLAIVLLHGFRRLLPPY